MSRQLERVLQNFAYQLTKIDTSAAPVNKKRYTEYEPPPRDECPTGSGGVRHFFVEYAGEKDDGGATDITARETEVVIRVNVEIPRCYSWRSMWALTAEIRHEVNKRLRDPQYFVGYADDAGESASGETGILSRRRSAGALDRTTNPAIWRYTTQWECWIRESES